jgi:hypothetical protein
MSERAVVDSEHPVGEDDEMAETANRWCPACMSDRIERVGLEHAINFGPWRALHRCGECASFFVLVRPRPL